MLRDLKVVYELTRLEEDCSQEILRIRRLVPRLRRAEILDPEKLNRKFQLTRKANCWCDLLLTHFPFVKGVCIKAYRVATGEDKQ